MTLHFFFDECADEDVARALIALGVDAFTAGMAGQKGFSDRDQIDFARQENRVIYTVDPDFLRLAADFQNRAEFFPGIVYHAKGSRTKRQIIDALVLLDGVFDPDDMHNRVEFM